MFISQKTLQLKPNLKPYQKTILKQPQKTPQSKKIPKNKNPKKIFFAIQNQNKVLTNPKKRHKAKMKPKNTKSKLNKSVNIFLSIFSFIKSSTLSFSSNQIFSIWSQLQLSQNTVTSINRNSNSSSILSIFINFFNIQTPSSSIYSGNFTFSTFKSSSNNFDCIIFSYR